MEESYTTSLFPPPEKLPRLESEADKGFRELTALASAAEARAGDLKFSDEVIASAVNKVDEASITDRLRRLVDFPTRHTLSPHNVEAAGWLHGEFASYGYTEVTFQDFKVEGLTRHNVICTKPGGPEPEKFVVVCAHYDSRMKTLTDSASAAPGAVDNASGTAVLLEAARVIRDVETRNSIRFAAFSGEEQGLVGSHAYAEAAKAAGTDIVLVINLDMVGHPVDAEKRAVIIERDVGNATTANDAASADFAAVMGQAAARYTSLKVKAGPIYDSDYMPFERLGYVCVGAFDGSTDAPFYHSSEDTLDKVETGFCAQVARMVVATVLMAAG